MNSPNFCSSAGGLWPRNAERWPEKFVRRFIPILFYGFTLVCLVGVLFGYMGMGLMKQHKVPPFNEGLYTAVWTMRPPPREIVVWCGSLSGAIAVGVGIVVFPAVLGAALFRLKWRVVGLGGMAVISAAVAWLGFWVWLWARSQLF